MSKRNRREHGRIISVETKTRGDALADDVAAGVTSITVEDAGDFDEDGGWLLIGAQVVEFTECDDDTGIITLADPLTAAAEQGDPVQVWSELYEEVVDYQQALVELDGEYDNPDPVVTEVAEGVGSLPEGDRGRAGESCTLHRVSEDEWEVVGVGGRGRQSQGIRWEQDDTYTLTAADITASSATMPLSHRPNDEALTCVLAGVPQRPTEWTIDYEAQTLTMPLGGWEQAGMVLWVHYAYRKGVKTGLVPPPVEYIIHTTGAVTVTDTNTGSGGQVPPAVVGSAPQWDDGSDGSYAELETFEHPDVSYTDSGGATLLHTSVPTSLPSGFGLYARVRYQTLNSDMATPRVSVYRSGSTTDVDQPVANLTSTPVPAAMTAPAWIDIPLTSYEGGGMGTFLTEIQPASSKVLTVQVFAPVLSAYSFRYPRIRIFEVLLVIKETA